MITDIPHEKDFHSMAVSLLNLAWETTLNLSLSIDEAVDNGVDVEEDLYWQTSQTQLTTSISLVQQAFEFFLKSRILAVSPFLLITGTAKTWPSGCEKKDTPFADFYTIDAQELIRTHDTVASVRLTEEVKNRFEDLRRKRNSIIHTVDKRLTVEVEEVILAVLEIADLFVGPLKWIETRRQHLKKSSDPVAYDSDGVTYRLARELEWIVETLKPSPILKFLGFDKRHRAYACPDCCHECRDDGIEPRIAFLAPNESTSTTLHCYVCGEDKKVVREDCKEEDCKGNVLNAEDGVCLTCLV